MSFLLSMILTLQLSLNWPLFGETITPNFVAQTSSLSPVNEVCITPQETLDSLRQDLINTIEKNQKDNPDFFDKIESKKIQTILATLKNNKIDNTQINLDKLNSIFREVINKYGDRSKIKWQLEPLYQIIPQTRKWKNVISLSTGEKNRFPCLTSKIPNLIEDHHTQSPKIEPQKFTQIDLTFLSWQSFIALNWPANSQGNPLNYQTIGNNLDSPRVWEVYKKPGEVFINPDINNPQNPFHKLSSSFVEQPTVPNACKASLNETVIKDIENRKIKLLYLSVNKDEVTKNADMLQAIPAVPLIDQNRNYVLYEVFMNEDEFDYIRDNQLYDADNQSLQEINFPSSSLNSMGAMEIKAAWRILPNNIAKNLKNRYYTKQALIYVPSKYTLNNQSVCQVETVGLVGFHILRKMKYQPQWVWSTFEHIDNAPQEQGIFGNSAPGDFAFWKSNCNIGNIGIECVPNNEPEGDYQHLLSCNASEKVSTSVNKNCLFPWSSKSPYANQFQPTQVERLNIIQDNRIVLGNNHDWHQLLNKVLSQENCSNSKNNCNSVWQYYQLVGTQWTDSSPSVIKDIYTDFDGTLPFQLANTTMETYIQESSCIKCHAAAKIAGSTKKRANFSFLLELAKSGSGKGSK